jgi:hypothetical protein
LVTLKIPIASAASTYRCSGLATRMESIVEAAKIHHLKAPMASAALQLQVPMAPTT